MDHDDLGKFVEGNQAGKGERALTAEERAARNVKKLTLMDSLDKYLTANDVEIEAASQDPKTIAVDKIALNLLRIACGRTMEPSIGAIRIVLDRTCGPVKQKVELSGNIFDLATMTKEQKIELLNELRKQRQAVG